MKTAEGNGKGIRNPLLRKIRRQVAQILSKVLAGDAQRQAQASVKSLIYEPSIVAKKPTMALTCHCLKYLPVLKEVVAATDLLSKKKHAPPELIYVLAYEILFGQEVLSSGGVESMVLSRKGALRSALVRLLVKRNVSSVDDLVGHGNEISLPRYVRVNTLKISSSEAIKHLQQLTDSVKEDKDVPNLLIIPAGIDLHKDVLIRNGSLLLQGKASCMPVLALAPRPGWEVLDACAAPGNKTVQLAASMKGRGVIYACEVDYKRLSRLQETVELAGASIVEVHHTDFLTVHPRKLPFSKVRGILLDPSCSGSGTSLHRLDYLLPSSKTETQIDDVEKQRIEQLGLFQERVLLHALSFPAVERLVYSTCSVHQRENEDVVKAVLPTAIANGFQLATALPDWPHRGLPVFVGAHHLVRTDTDRDKTDGFFVALFVRDQASGLEGKVSVDSSEECWDINRTALDSHKIEAANATNFSSSTRPLEVSSVGELSKLKRRKLKRQRRKERLVAVERKRNSS